MQNPYPNRKKSTVAGAYTAGYVGGAVAGHHVAEKTIPKVTNKMKYGGGTARGVGAFAAADAGTVAGLYLAHKFLKSRSHHTDGQPDSPRM